MKHWERGLENAALSRPWFTSWPMTYRYYVPVKSKLQHQPPGIWTFGKFLFKFPPHRAKKLFKCPHPRENYQITWSCACKHGLLDNTYLYTINSNTEHSLCRPLVFNQSATNTQSFPLNSSKFAVCGKLRDCFTRYTNPQERTTKISAMIYLVTWHRG